VRDRDHLHGGRSPLYLRIAAYGYFLSQLFERHVKFRASVHNDSLCQVPILEIDRPLGMVLGTRAGEWT